MTKPMVVFTTVAKKSDANKISKTLLAQELAACVTTLPQGESRYRWKGKLCVEREYILMIKTLSTTFTKLEKTLREIHPYDCPEIVGISVDKVSKPYGEWIQRNTK